MFTMENAGSLFYFDLKFLYVSVKTDISERESVPAVMIIAKADL